MDAIINQDALLALIDAAVERKLAEHLAKTAPAPANPLGIDPNRLYTRQETCKLLGKSYRTIIRAEQRKDSKRLIRRGPSSKPEYLGKDLLRLAKIEAA